MQNDQVHLYVDHHQNDAEYGKSAPLHYEYIAAVVHSLKVASVIDYGCGKNIVADSLSAAGVSAAKYDPAIPGIDAKPEGRFDCIINTDVLEHIPEPDLPGILAEFKRLAPSAIIIPHLGKAVAVLPNGENAHCTIKTPQEWRAVLSASYLRVLQLPHHSSLHALFFCTDTDVDASRLPAIAQVVCDLKSRPAIDERLLSARLTKRLRGAVKLMAGRRGMELLGKR